MKKVVPYLTYLGLRPGEKLYEELLVKTEELDKTPNSMIFIERDTPLCEHDIDVKLEELKAACETEDLEVSYVHGEAKVGEHCVLSYIDIHDEMIPDNVVMHGLKQRDGKFIVRIFGVNDNPKENRLFGMDLEQIEKDLDVKLWPDDSHTLWSAALYPEADTIEEAVSAALNLYAIVHGEEQADLSAWKAAPKKSLCSGFNDADPDAIIAWNRRMADGYVSCFF